MADKFFVEHKVQELHAKTVEALTKPSDGFDSAIPFTGARAKALLQHQVGIANLVADATVGRIGIVKATTEILDVRLARVEAICGGWPTDEGEKQASVYYSEDIAAHTAQINKLQTQISGMAKQIAALSRQLANR